MAYAPEHEPLYAELAVPSLDEPQLIARFLLRELSELSAPVMERTLARVLEQWSAWRDNPELCTALAKAPFVMDGWLLDLRNSAVRFRQMGLMEMPHNQEGVTVMLV